MPTELKIMLFAYGITMVLAAVVGEIALHLVNAWFGPGREGRRLRRSFNWACRQAGACFYFAVSLHRIRELPFALSEGMAPMVTSLQVGACVFGALFTWWAVDRWHSAARA